MQQNFPPGQQMKTRKAVVIFLKDAASPVVLYVENPDALYDEIKDIVSKPKSATSNLIEKAGKGPLKKLAILDTQIVGVAIQEEQYMG